MTKSKSSKVAVKSQFIDMKEINETLDKNEDIIKNLIYNYHNTMSKIGNTKDSLTKSPLIRIG